MFSFAGLPLRWPGSGDAITKGWVFLDPLYEATLAAVAQIRGGPREVPVAKFQLVKDAVVERHAIAVSQSLEFGEPLLLGNRPEVAV